MLYPQQLVVLHNAAPSAPALLKLWRTQHKQSPNKDILGAWSTKRSSLENVPKSKIIFWVIFVPPLLSPTLQRDKCSRIGYFREFWRRGLAPAPLQMGRKHHPWPELWHLLTSRREESSAGLILSILHNQSLAALLPQQEDIFQL